MAVKKGSSVINPVRKLTNNAPPKYLAEKIKSLPKSSIPADQVPYMNKEDKIDEKKENKYNARPS